MTFDTDIDKLIRQLDQANNDNKLDDEGRVLVANKFERQLADFRRPLEIEWERLLTTERDKNSENTQLSSAERNEREVELFGQALDLLPQMRKLTIDAEDLLARLRAQPAPDHTGSIDKGLQALKAGELAYALVLFAGTDESDVKRKVQSQREDEAKILLQQARNARKQIDQFKSDKERSQERERIQREFLAPVRRIGREYQREEAAGPPPPGCSLLVRIVVALVSLVLVSLILVFVPELDWLQPAHEPTSTPEPSRVTERASPTSSPFIVSSLTPTLDTAVTATTVSPAVTETPVIVASPTPTNIITIASVSPLTGPRSDRGIGIRNGAELAVSQQQEPLNGLGFDVEFASFDDEGDPESGIAHAQTIVDNPNVLCVVGHLNSEVTVAAYEAAYSDANLIVISPGATNPEVTDATNNIWRLVGRDDVQGRFAAEFAHNPAPEGLGSQRAYVIYEDTAYGEGFEEIFSAKFTELGGTIVGSESFNPQLEVDFSPFVDDISGTEPAPDLIFFIGPYTQAGLFFDMAREQGITANFMGPDSLDHPGLLEQGGEAVAGMHFTTVGAHIQDFSGAEPFVQDYNAEYDETPPPASFESYDAAWLCIKAITRATEANDGQKPTRQQVAEAMRELAQEGFEDAISGPYQFNQDGDPVRALYYVMRVDESNWEENEIVEKDLVELSN
jgi:ABC-type branched-subunit amino acid transport system substrate-binding protein